MRASRAATFLAISTLEVTASALSRSTSLHTQLLNAPDLHLHVTVMSDDLLIHDQPVFDVVAKPVATEGARVRYDGFVTFVPNGDTKVTYMLVDGASYVVDTVADDTTFVATQTARCHSPTVPFDAILPALNNATPVSSASVRGHPVTCPGGALFETSFGEIDFVLCASGASGLVAYSDKVRVEVTYLESLIRGIFEPTLSDPSASCVSAVTDTTVTPTTLALLTGKET
jgi:hypothetical protein